MSVKPIVTDFLESERLSPISAFTPDAEKQILLKTQSPEEPSKSSKRYDLLSRADPFGEKPTIQFSPIRKNM